MAQVHAEQRSSADQASSCRISHSGFCMAMLRKRNQNQAPNRFMQGKLLDYTVDEKTAGLFAAQRALASLAQSVNASIRANAPQLYQQYKVLSVTALDECIADEEARPNK